MISLKNVTKSYPLDGEIFVALDNASLEIKEGEFISIIGPSGSGKSTLMHIVGLLDRPTSGKILVDSTDISTLSDNAISRLRNQYLGFIFQQFNLVNKLTVKENIVLPAIYARHKLDFDPNFRAMELLARFGIAEKATSFPNKLSGGQQQRVAIARALIMNPKIILADEPTGNLDTKTGEKILALLTELNKKDGITIVIVTHDPDIAKRTKRKIEIRDGKII